MLSQKETKGTRLQAMNAYTTYTKSTNARSEQVPMHTVEEPACL